MGPVDDQEISRLLVGYSAGRLTGEEERALFEAAARDQSLYNEVMEAEALRSAFRTPDDRGRAIEVLRHWEATAEPAQDLPMAAAVEMPRREPVWATVLRPALTSFATALAGSLSYALLKNVGSSLGLARPSAAVTQTQPVPSVLFVAHAAIAALLLGLQFTPFLRPQELAARAHPVASKCLAQFVRGWRWAWAAWLALYVWLSINPAVNSPLNPITDVLNGLTAFPLFWCFLVLDKPSVALPQRPNRDAAFRRAVATTWGVGAGVIALAIASRMGWWGLGGFGVAFLGIYIGLSIAFLVGRFDSHWMQVPRWMLAPLYGYALIQMIYVFFDQIDPAWSVYTYLVALLLKVCLFFIVTHLLHAGNIGRYLVAGEKGELGPQSAG